jgi:CheY-like chemotaxis protein
VVVITGMAAPGDAQRAQELGATGFMLKPFSFDKQVELARQIRANWLQPVRQLAKA